MAIDVQAQRAEGVSPLDMSIARGSQGKNDDGSAAGDSPNLPTTSMDEERLGGPPGAHVNRGVEPNTAWSGPGNTADPTIDCTTGGELPVAGTPFATPDSSGLNATDGNGPAWDSADASAHNSSPTDIPHDSFSAMGEPPYTKDQPDGRT